MTADLLTLTERGLYCPAGDFYIDPWQPVPRAVITHAHADHARRGSDSYLAARDGELVLRTRLGDTARIDTLPYGENVLHNGVRISLHPAGHILGSAQVRIEHNGQVWVVSGDYKLEADPTCAAFEPVACHVFVSESTFGLPIYRWPPQAEVFSDINAWWRSNQAAGKASLLFGYALGKSQRLLAGIDPAIGPIYLHGAVDRLVKDYRAAGVPLPPMSARHPPARAGTAP
jgi:putative mRNA 3-end processing factor